MPLECPAGYYCSNGTTFATQHACPVGTFNNFTHRTSLSQCVPCRPGYYCESEGLTEPTGLCTGGYFCGGGSSVSTPHESDMFHVSYVGETCVSVNMSNLNDICPPGHYCPEGSPSPVQCPPGTNTSSIGLVSVGQCQSCVKGYYCPNNGTVHATRLCLAGYYCPSGTSNPADFAELSCPTGHYCPEGSDVPIACESGSYQDERGKSECKLCPEGYYCERNTTTPMDCPAGYYCPSQTDFATQYPCPNGTYSNSTLLTSVGECDECTPGYYCGYEALTEPTGLCTGGYFCGGGSSVSTPTRATCSM